MATDAERHRAFNDARARAERERARIERDTTVDVRDLVAEAQRRIAARLAGDASDFARWLDPQLQRSLRSVLDDLGERTGGALAAGAERSWDAGIAGVDAPLDAALRLDAPGVEIRSMLAHVDRRQLAATRTWLTGKMRDVTAATAQRVNTELAQVMLGVENPSDAVTRISGLLDQNRRRAVTIARTELGRAYSHAGQARMAQAREALPGLRKQWRRSGKLRERPGHVAMDGQVRDVDEPFTTPDGLELAYPRDPAAPPGETVNCGCQSLPYMESWERAGALRHAGARPAAEAAPAVVSGAGRGERAEVVNAGDDGPVTVRSAADPQPGFRIPAHVTARGAQHTVQDLAARGESAAVRTALRGVTHSAEFAVAFGRGDLRGWPVGMLPDLLSELPEDVLDSLALRRRIPREMFAPRLVIDAVRPGKLRRKHPEVTLAQYQGLQRALDAGELVFESASGKRKMSHLIAHAPRGEGWWRYPLKIDTRRGVLRLASIYPIGGRHTATVLRPWDPRRWAEEG